MPRLILFVCGSNRTRSPLAAAYFSSLLKARNIHDIEVASAGIAVHHGDTLAQETRTVMAKRGLQPVAIGTTALMLKLVRYAELILCMTDKQEELIEEKFPSAIGKCRPLNAVIKSPLPIAEPPKGSVMETERCLDSMIPALNALLDIVQ